MHVVATVSILGADLVLLLRLSSLSGADPRTIYPAAHLVSARLVAPMAVLSLGTGLLQGILTPWGLLRYWWVTIKLAITAVLRGAVLFVLGPGLSATADAVSGPSPYLLTIGERLPLVVAPVVASTLQRSQTRSGAIRGCQQALPFLAFNLFIYTASIYKPRNAR